MSTLIVLCLAVDGGLALKSVLDSVKVFDGPVYRLLSLKKKVAPEYRELPCKVGEG